jgi:hypothetical protein
MAKGGLRLFLTLVHYPVYDRKDRVVATAITNLDIHDLARAGRTFGAEALLVVNPLQRQQWLLRRIVEHWRSGHGADAHPNRREALSRVHPVGTLEEARHWVRDRCGVHPLVLATTARSFPEAMGYGAMRSLLVRHEGPVMILFGTGWGLTREVIQGADYILRPILEGAEYNHLSVRSAAAIILDRLFGDRLEREVSADVPLPVALEGAQGLSGAPGTGSTSA